MSRIAYRRASSSPPPVGARGPLRQALRCSMTKPLYTSYNDNDEATPNHSKQCIGETEDLNSKKRIGLVSLRAHAKVHTPTTTAVILA